MTEGLMKAHHQSGERKCNIQHQVSNKGRMNLNTTKSIVFKVEHDQWGVEKEHAIAKSNTGLSLAQSTKASFSQLLIGSPFTLAVTAR